MHLNNKGKNHELCKMKSDISGYSSASTLNLLADRQADILKATLPILTENTSAYGKKQLLSSVWPFPYHCNHVLSSELQALLAVSYLKNSASSVLVQAR